MFKRDRNRETIGSQRGTKISVHLKAWEPTVGALLLDPTTESLLPAHCTLHIYFRLATTKSLATDNIKKQIAENNFPQLVLQSKLTKS